ncbi:GlsB/YeaQ/YmgE family stress response membrane protein [Caulobacter mirabilis]|uniref:GlsB/YeaQ/YmgE family stress response membrane protein n=1 Tax=Caulobacter mirabilis TaxID=69666 RepID=A0A2D2AXQ1_9CAUL|nr:GlsB/YeaQ/YmgE family stress response membrane protein [Caulobacter mirabilis]ATQ42788.1 GlsB/YeaQ/YmgE family stress response membrane protein [Caulobacter mirabilis]
MQGVGFFGAIIIGIFAGWIAERIMNRNHGIVVNLIVGLVGALIGSWLAGIANLPYSGWIASLIASVIGAIVLLFILGLFKRK